MGELICEFSSEHISFAEVKEHEDIYSKDAEIGCFMHYCKYKGSRFW